MVCVDGSPFGDRAFEYTLNHIDQTKDQIVVVYAVEYIKSQFPHPSEFYQQLQNQLNDESQKHAHQILEAYENKLKAANVKHKVEQLSGDSAKLLIVKYVEENDVDNLVLGRRSLGTQERKLLGSTTDYCLHNAHANVVIVKYEIIAILSPPYE